ncbi:hypothetical protein DMUE_1845 [Dictyocoela muelleri]|nr:hypothetical protein DMUE_1845 [Dictyocoela muelleri]
MVEKTWCKKKNCVTDSGRQFASSIFEHLMNGNNVKRILTSPHNPSGNAVIERINNEIGVSLRFSRTLSLKECSGNIWRRLNLTVNKSTEHSPFRIFFNNKQLLEKNLRMK